MMKRRIRPLLLALLVLTGCSLARPEKEGDEDRFVGFYLVRDESGEGMGFYRNPHLEEYGGETVSLDGYGSFSLPREVLFAQKEGREWVFPGLEGWRLFVYRGVGEDGGTYMASASDLSGGEFHIKSTDEGDTETISGTLYLGPPLGQEDWDPYEDRSVWTAYRVYQAPDGRPYLDGSGNSFSGGAPSSYRETQTRTDRENGQTVKEETVEASVSVETVPRLEKLAVAQFDENNVLLRREELEPGENLAVARLPGAVWVLVEEHSGDGAVRTAYTLPGPGEEPIVHPFIALDSAGVGREVELTIGGQP